MALALTTTKHRFLAAVLFVGVAVALAESIARAGLVMVFITIIAFTAWRHFGRFLTIAISAVAGYFVFHEFASQGATASHSDGLLGGLIAGITAPLGTGYGTGGYQADASSQSDSGVSESLLGLYFLWMGIPIILVVAWVAMRVIQNILATNGEVNRIVWFAAALLLAAALSETASSLGATALAWMIFVWR